MGRFKKVLVITTALLSLTAASVMAIQDAGSYLEKWYKAAYDTSLQATTPVMADGLMEIRNIGKSPLVTEKEEAAAKLKTFYLSTISQSKDDLESYQENYKQRLAKVKASLEDSDFSDVVEKEKANLELEITDDVEEMLSDLLSSK